FVQAFLGRALVFIKQQQHGVTIQRSVGSEDRAFEYALDQHDIDMRRDALLFGGTIFRGTGFISTGVVSARRPGLFSSAGVGRCLPVLLAFGGAGVVSVFHVLFFH